MSTGGTNWSEPGLKMKLSEALRDGFWQVPSPLPPNVCNKWGLMQNAVDLRRDGNSVLDRLDEDWKADAGDGRLEIGTFTRIAMVGSIVNWANHGFPVLSLKSAQYAASLIATRVYEPRDIRLPWPSFLIEIPDGTFPEKPSPTRFVLVGEVPGAFRTAWLISANGTGTILISESDRFFRSDGIPIAYRRESACMARLMANACLAVTEQEPSPTIHLAGRSDPRTAGRRHKYASYVIGRPVRIDCRPELHLFLSGRRSTTPSVRWLVRGHWRNQAHGAGQKERRLQWIEPHWKGDANAPINVRPHVLKGSP